MVDLDRDDYVRVKRIVDAALSLPVEERLSYLDQACGAGALREEVDSLLAAAICAAPLYENLALSIAGTDISSSVGAGSEGETSPAAVAARQLRSFLDDGFAGTDRYQVRRRIGGGGMGVVYEVHDRLRRQIVALKTIRRRHGRDIYQLKREFRNLADVAHPNLASMYDLVVEAGQCFFTMELVDGVTFVDYVRRPSGEGPAARVRRLLPQLVDGVEEMHRRGMLHRDIKPSNVLVTAEERVVILDFGLSLPQRQGPTRTEAAGTPAYLSPEQCAGGEASRAGDWYGVGATIYHALTGRPPFESASARDLIARKVTEDPLPVRQLAPEVSPELDAVCMGLLARDPERRLSGPEALERLGTGQIGTAQSSLRSWRSSAAPVFVGRVEALATLAAALSKARGGRSATVLIHGPSGIGKSALVRQFLETHVAGRECLTVRSRCHEHESIPYKGLDGVVDGMTQYLAGLPPAELAEVLPEDAEALATLFPVLSVVGLTPLSEHGDPIALRRKAFDGFRSLIGAIARRHPLVVEIDDFHWADADSVAWLTALLHPPSPASVLLVLSFRSKELDATPFLRPLLERIDIGDRLSLPVMPLSADETAAMVTALGGADPDMCAVVTEASGGNPFFVDALTRHLLVHPVSRARASLEEMLTRRIELLPPESAAFLDALAVCGRPVLPERIFEACGFAGDERPLVARLRAAHLIQNSRSGERVEIYHDRIRDVLAARITPERARHIHDVLARTLVAHGDDDPEALFEHYRAAGHEQLAASQAAAAGAKAAGVLAFDLAATFYRQALALHPESDEHGRWTAGLARALENAGRPVEAAETYLRLVARTEGAERFEARRKAAELLLIGGQIDRGLAVSNDVLASVGLRLARGPRTAIASLLLRRLQLRWRGLEFTPADESTIAPRDLQAVDACWAISSGLAMVDPLRAAALNVRQLLRALDVGDPYRIARAMALESGFSVVGIGPGRDRSEAFSRRALALSTRAGSQYVAALTSLWEGIAAFLTGQWVKASDYCGRAATTLREHHTGVTWELNMAHNFYLGALVARGELREVAGHLPGLVASARERGNSYLELELSTRLILAWLTADDPDEAQRRGDAGIARWSQRGFQRQHYGHMLMRVQVALYRGRALEAWQLIERCQRPLRHSQFLRVQHTRIESSHFRARCALALAAAGQQTARMQSVAMHEAGRMRREQASWATPWATLVQSTVWHQTGRIGAARTGLAQAADEFAGADMHLYAAVCRRRLGALIGGHEGQRLHAQTDEWMRAQAIRNPSAMAAVLSPGLPDRLT